MFIKFIGIVMALFFSANSFLVLKHLSLVQTVPSDWLEVAMNVLLAFLGFMLLIRKDS